MQSRLWYWEMGGFSLAPPGPRRRTTKKELSSVSHRKSSPRGPSPGFSSATEEAEATKAVMKPASQFQRSSDFSVPLGAARTRRGPAARYAQLSVPGPLPAPPS